MSYFGLNFSNIFVVIESLVKFLTNNLYTKAKQNEQSIRKDY